MPSTLMRLRRLEAPDSIASLDRGTSRMLARNRRSAALAAPSTGGAATRIWIVPSASCAIEDLPARGTTTTESRLPCGWLDTPDARLALVVTRRRAPGVQ